MGALFVQQPSKCTFRFSIQYAAVSIGLVYILWSCMAGSFKPFSPCSWDMMMSCWMSHPHQRPAFSSLVNQLFDMLDSDSTYLKLVNPCVS